MNREEVEAVDETSAETLESLPESAEEEKDGAQCTSPQEIEKQQEAQLRSKYPGMNRPGSSVFLQKRLSKGTKFFDSGDYNMAKACVGPRGRPQMLAPGQKLMMPGSVGDVIPTPDTVPHKKLTMPHSSVGGLS